MKEKMLGAALLAVFFLGSVFLADRALGLAGFPSEPPLSVAHPAHFVQHRHNLDFKHSIKTNDQGLRYEDIPLKKDPAKEFRVAVVGDSFTEGLGVEAEDTFPSILENRFAGAPKKVRFINLGLINAGPEEETRLLYYRALKYEPDLILLVLYANDVVDAAPRSDDELSTGQGWLFPRTTVWKKERQGLKAAFHRLLPRLYTLLMQVRESLAKWRPPDLIAGTVKEARRRGISEERIGSWLSALDPRIVREANELQFDGYLYADGLLHPERWIEGLDLNGGGAEEKWRTVSAILDRFAAICKDNHLPLGVVYAPAPFQADPAYVSPSQAAGVVFRKEWLTEDTELQKRFTAWSKERGLPYLDLTGPFREAAAHSPGRMNFRHDPHWTKEGNSLAADAISQWLRRESLVPPSADPGERR